MKMCAQNGHCLGNKKELWMKRDPQGKRQCLRRKRLDGLRKGASRREYLPGVTTRKAEVTSLNFRHTTSWGNLVEKKSIDHTIPVMTNNQTGGELRTQKVYYP